MKDRADDGKAARGEKSPANPLNEPGGNKQLDRRRRRAQRGSGHEDRRPQGEHAAPAIDVAERTGCQDKRREREHVTVQRPLQPRDARVQITADRRQRHVDDGRLQQHHRLAQHRHRQHPAAGGRSQPHRAGPAALIPHQLPPSRSLLGPPSSVASVGVALAADRLGWLAHNAMTVVPSARQARAGFKAARAQRHPAPPLGGDSPSS